MIKGLSGSINISISGQGWGGGGSRGRIRGVSTHLGDDNSFFLEFVCVIKVKIKRGFR